LSDFELTWQDVEGELALLHCDVHNWDRGVARDLDRAVGALFDGLLEEGYEAAFTISQNQKFCKYMGGTLRGDFVHMGKQYWVYSWVMD